MIKTFSDFVVSDNLDEINISHDTVKNHLILLYCREGRIQVDIEEKQVVVRKNNLLMCKPQFLIDHYMRTPDFSCLLLCVGEHSFDEILSDCFYVEPNWWKKKTYLQEHPVAVLNEYQNKLLDAYFNLLLVSFEDVQTSYRQRVIKLLAQSISYEILGNLENSIDVVQEDEHVNVSSRDTIFLKFVDLLYKPGNTEREVRWYSEALLISPKYLTTICREKSGNSASELITKVIVGNIKNLLLKTDLSIKEIAYRMDFPDVSFFCKYVKKHLGSAPLEFRRLNS